MGVASARRQKLSWRVSEFRSSDIRTLLTDLDTHWDPLGMLGDTLRGRVPRELPQPNANKIATFILTEDLGERIVRKDVKTIPRHSSSSLRSTMGFLLPAGRISVRADVSNKFIRSFEELWSSIQSSDDPVFWVRRETENQNSPTPVLTGQRSQRDYSNHAVLKLEHMVGKLDDQDRARSAQSRFNLIKENHPHSADLVRELENYFAPLEQATMKRWQRLSTRKQMCEEAMNDNAQFYKLRHLIADLDNAQQVHAQQYFTLITTNNPLANVAAENLIKLFTPGEAEVDEVSKMMSIFDEIKKDMIESGEAEMQS